MVPFCTHGLWKEEATWVALAWQCGGLLCVSQRASNAMAAVPCERRWRPAVAVKELRREREWNTEPRASASGMWEGFLWPWFCNGLGVCGPMVPSPFVPRGIHLSVSMHSVCCFSHCSIQKPIGKAITKPLCQSTYVFLPMVWFCLEFIFAYMFVYYILQKGLVEKKFLFLTTLHIDFANLVC